MATFEHFESENTTIISPIFLFRTFTSMSATFPHWFLAIHSLLAALVFISIHRYLRAKLGERQDSGLIWVSLAFAVWMVMGVWEAEQAYLTTQLIDKPGFLRIRRMLSIINTGFLVYSLAFFQNGWQRLSEAIRRINPLTIILVIAGACFLVSPFPEGKAWLYIETAISIAVMLLLGINLALSFQARRMPLMLGLTILTVAAFLVVQVNEWMLEIWDVQLPETLRQLIRLGARSSLALCFAVLALTWLGDMLTTPLEKERSPGYKEVEAGIKQLRFGIGADNQLFFEMTWPEKGLKNARVDAGKISPHLLKMFFKLALDASRNKSVHYSAFATNFSQWKINFRDQLASLLPPGSERLKVEDLFLKDQANAGYHSLSFRAEEIEIPAGVAERMGK
ncbi:MAG: hypothetical protein IPH04_15555 [Saprospirales bacterium]|nr:hypothetical protein [Saprospirales bacterium]